jgi:DNA-binding CsgD family transcriptional regulator
VIERRPYSPPEVVSRSSSISPEKQRRIRELRAEGLTMAVISERLGLHLNTIAKYLERLGLVPRLACGCATRGRPREPRCTHPEAPSP